MGRRDTESAAETRPAGDLKIGMVGIGNRGRSLGGILRLLGTRLSAVCDQSEEKVRVAQQESGAQEAYSDFERMLDRAKLDAVIIGTPMHLHARQSIAALERGVHVLCEVTAGVTVEECRALVAAAKRSSAKYMLAENCNYYRNHLLVAELVRQGAFGEVYYAESEYLHDVKELFELTPWRRMWHGGINGITYGTHCLGPVLQWMGGDRIVSVCCAGSGHHYRDAQGKPFENEDGCVMLARTRRGALIKVRVDILSNRPYSLNYQLQGTEGCYESSRSGTAAEDRLWLRQLSAEPRWHAVEELLKIDEFAQRWMPALWRNPSPAVVEAGHHGGDYFVIREFLRAVAGGAAPPIGIHEAMDMTLPGLMSQQSIARGSAWMEVPDSRQW